MTDLGQERVDAIVREVAARLPFAVELVADMGGESWTLQIDLGRRGGKDDPPDTASIEPALEPAVWFFDIAGGLDTVQSSYGLDADPADVAAWIASEARRVGSPAATSATAVAAMGYGVAAAEIGRTASSSEARPSRPAVESGRSEADLSR